MDSLTVSVILVTKAMATGAQVCCYVLSLLYKKKPFL